MKTYAITIIRFGEDDEQEVLLDKWVTADETIDLLVQLQSASDSPLDSEEEAAEVEEDVEEVIEEEEPTQPAQPAKKSRAVNYDREAMVADVKAGVLTTAQISEKYGINLNVIYQVRNKLKKQSELVDDTPGETEYARKQRERAANPNPEVNVEAEIRLAAIQGFSLSEISDMYPTVPLETISRIKADARR